ncbi:MAG: hypothetical protein IPI35_35405 [Deltaproteobacteria bacterium]|nr:hypothetical protein [Deltaproteobacteria bacterium]
MLSGEWYLRNLHPNDQPIPFYQPGQVIYKMWPAENRYSDEYNIVRHALATWNLVQAYQIEPRPEFIEGARGPGLHAVVPQRRGETASYLAQREQRQFGSVVIAVMGMIDRRHGHGKSMTSC